MSTRPAPHPQEQQRLHELYEFSILDCVKEKEFDELTALAVKLFDMPISFINLVDEKQQFTMSNAGCDLRILPREVAFCSHTILQEGDVMVVEDTLEDERFKENPLVHGEPYIRSYAGAKLLTDNGLPLGSFCLIGREPRVFSKREQEILVDLANQAMNLVRNRKKRVELEMTNEVLERRNEKLKMFAATAAHDVQSPLTTIYRLSQLLEKRTKDQLNQRDQEILLHIKIATQNLRRLVSGLLEYSTTESLGEVQKEPIVLREFLDELRPLLSKAPENLQITIKSDEEAFSQNRAVLKQILLNLVNNSIVHGAQEDAQIEIGFKEKGDFHHFYVKDNGPGIPPEQRKNIFRAFTTLDSSPGREGERHYGLGLATVKRLVQFSGGKVNVDSSPGNGATFFFSLRK